MGAAACGRSLLPRVGGWAPLRGAYGVSSWPRPSGIAGLLAPYAVGRGNLRRLGYSHYPDRVGRNTGHVPDTAYFEHHPGSGRPALRHSQHQTVI
jgi:hypothetical protein